MCAWDAAVPAGSDNISLGDNVIRELKTDLATSLSADGVFPGADAANPKFVWTGQRGVTSSRPSSPATGQLYFNTQLFQLEYYSGASWVGYDLVPLLGISTGRIADLAVTTAKINDLAVTTGKINDLGVTTGKINDLAVTTGKLAALAITDAKVNDLSASKITAGTLAVTRGGTGITTSLIKKVTYTGDGLNNRTVAHTLGDTPDLVLLCTSNNTNAPVFWMNGFAATVSRRLDGTVSTTSIIGVDATNITLGTNTDVNGNTIPYILFSFKSN